MIIWMRDWSPEKGCYSRLTLRQPVRKPSSESSDIGSQNVSRQQESFSGLQIITQMIIFNQGIIIIIIITVNIIYNNYYQLIIIINELYSLPFQFPYSVYSESNFQ